MTKKQYGKLAPAVFVVWEQRNSRGEVKRRELTVKDAIARQKSITTVSYRDDAVALECFMMTHDAHLVTRDEPQWGSAS